MTGWNLKFGELKDNENVNLLSIISNVLISKKFKTTTYKYCLVKCILDNLFSIANNELDYKTLNKTFAEVYWNLINVFDIPQMYQNNSTSGSGIEILIHDMVKEKPQLAKVYFENLDVTDKLFLYKKCFAIFKNYVVGALYADTEGYLYGFNQKEQKIYFNKRSLEFLEENKLLIEQLNYYEWLKLCEDILNRNKLSCELLSQKLEWITKRKNLLKYKNKLLELKDDQVCFYCGKKCTKSSHLDHVFPWDFIKKDELWNLVWCCSKCNLSKSDSIPSKEFLDKLVQRNIKLGIEMPDIEKVYKVAINNGVKHGWKPKE